MSAGVESNYPTLVLRNLKTSGRLGLLSMASLAAILIFGLLPDGISAHEIPNDVTVQAFLKPEGERLRLLVRVPLEAMQDMEWPTFGPGYLDVDALDASLNDAATLWLSDNIQMYEGDTRLPDPTVLEIRVSLPSDRSFGSYEQALAHLTGARLGNDSELYWEQALLDVLFEYSIQSDRSQFSIDPAFERLALRVLTVLRFLTPDGAVRAFELPGAPGLVRLDPRWHQAALRFVELGFFHILDGIDHLLFLLCLVIPFRRFRPLVVIVTSFTVAHSVTLIASAFSVAPDSLWFPPLVETLIAMSIVYMALENIVGAKLERRWMITFGFGLIHGFGFSFALHETLQFAGSHLLTSLLSFNIGVELGQLMVLALLIPALELLFRYAVAERIGIIILSVLVTHTAWHWMIERAGILGQYSLPELNAALLASAMRWSMLIVLLAGVVWILSGVVRGWQEKGKMSVGAGDEGSAQE